jgi:two-component system CheB/CheR fusion protein
MPMSGGTHRLQIIAHDIPDDMQVASGHLMLRKMPVDWGVLMQQILRTEATARVSYRIDLEAGEQCTVRAGARRLERVATDLVSNATKCSPTGIRVIAHVERWGSFARLSVAD